MLVKCPPSFFPQPRFSQLHNLLSLHFCANVLPVWRRWYSILYVKYIIICFWDWSIECFAPLSFVIGLCGIYRVLPFHPHTKHIHDIIEILLNTAINASTWTVFSHAYVILRLGCNILRTSLTLHKSSDLRPNLTAHHVPAPHVVPSHYSQFNLLNTLVIF
jgi:hypothetical protein